MKSFFIDFLLHNYFSAKDPAAIKRITVAQRRRKPRTLLIFVDSIFVRHTTETRMRVKESGMRSYANLYTTGHNLYLPGAFCNLSVSRAARRG
jgi:hypothetical protein